MSIFEVLLPVLLVVGGILMTVYSKQVGHAFCELGKASWRISTFGLTDMRWFYSEERAPRTFSAGGVILVFFGIVAAVMSAISLHGPNSLAAMRQAKDYLNKTHGDSKGKWSLLCKNVNDSDSVNVEYQFAETKGILHGDWNGKIYTFTEVEKSPTMPSSESSETPDR